MNQQEEKIPTKEEIVKFLTEQIEVKKLQVDLQELNTKLAVHRAEEMKALSFIGQMTNPQTNDTPYQGDGVPHKVTQEDLDLNPEMIKAGLEVGDEILIPQQQEVKRELKKKK